MRLRPHSRNFPALAGFVLQAHDVGGSHIKCSQLPLYALLHGREFSMAGQQTLTSVTSILIFGKN